MCRTKGQQEGCEEECIARALEHNISEQRKKLLFLLSILQLSVLCLYLGCIRNPFVLVLHLKIKFVWMNFSMPMNSFGKYKVGNSRKTNS